MNNSKEQEDFDREIQRTDLPENMNQKYQQEQSFGHGSNQISEIEKFIQKNYRDVTDLQSYLINELQNIQNCKNRNKKIEKIILSTILPTLQQTKQSINSLKSIFDLVNSLSSNYIEALAEKSRNLLVQKQQKCHRYQSQIKSLKREVEQFKQKQLTKKLSYEEFDQNLSSKIKISKDKFQDNRKLENQLSDVYEQKQKKLLVSNNKVEKNLNSHGNTPKYQHQVTRFRVIQQQPAKKKSPNKINKYEQCYQNILKAKKVNIAYKCEKTPVRERKESVSPSKTPSQLNSTRKTYRQEQQTFAEDRKQYIKQKIEKIKLKAECKQYQRNMTPKQRYR